MKEAFFWLRTYTRFTVASWRRESDGEQADLNRLRAGVPPHSLCRESLHLPIVCNFMPALPSPTHAAYSRT
jgi:hypothetical protein